MKLVEIAKCSECPQSMYINTNDPQVPRVHIGCGILKQSFDYGDNPLNPVIPAWCPLPDAPKEK